MATLCPTHTLTQISNTLSLVVATPEGPGRFAGMKNKTRLGAERVKGVAAYHARQENILNKN